MYYIKPEMNEWDRAFYEGANTFSREMPLEPPYEESFLNDAWLKGYDMCSMNGIPQYCLECFTSTPLDCLHNGVCEACWMESFQYMESSKQQRIAS